MLHLNIKIYKTIILLVVLYGCDTWTLTLKDNGLRVFKYRVLRRIFGYLDLRDRSGGRRA
jgi:hypothetical protein